MGPTYHISVILNLILACGAIAVESEQGADNNAETISAPIRLADIQQCPVSPKPMCEDNNCQGSTWVCPTQFLCSSETPVHAPDGRCVVLTGCRCCPHPIDVWCSDSLCAAPEDTRTCVAEDLQGCMCMTGPERTRLAEEDAHNIVWASDGSFEVDLEPDDDDRALTTTSTLAVMPTMETIQPLVLLRGYLAAHQIDKF
ncbi:hypothetical protein B0I35DRAFT_447028 [Stachybotrys elegans]|uniref:Uncharacterized protein n=1 Tax=Stachybotrys elegans TaxID=80388 RepID=A0A8K0SFJ3_9HYPO|nr:hypothetical protein B0I35DRAFT_447028 [Stachybotrys elegans]